MKKITYLIPIILILAFSLISNRLMASGSINPSTMVIVMAVVMLILILIRPKSKQAPKPVSDIESKVRGDFAKDAFADDAQLNAKFQSALKDYSGNMPKSAFNKLTKLAPLCRNDQEKYAVSIATAMVQVTSGKFVEAARLYTSALILHPSSDIAMEQGSCYQRLGELGKARSAYEYAYDLDGTNIEALSAIATTHVADRNYEAALETAKEVLEKNETHASALATTAICYGLLNDPVMSKHYTDKAVANGYSQKKIKDTIDALKK